MNAKELLEWLEERGELYICKADGGSYTVVARAADGVLKTAAAIPSSHGRLTAC